MPNPQILTITFFLLILMSCQETQYQKKNRIENQQLAVRQSVGLMYGQNTETMTFSVPHMLDFIVKSVNGQEIKGNLHTYWKQNNVYISSQYREGQNMRIIIYEDNYRILLDKNFYVTYGFKFTAEKNKVYTLRFLDQGKISKLMAVQLSKTLTTIQNKLNTTQLQTITTKLSNLYNQLKILSTISQFSIIMSETNLNNLYSSFDKYWYYLVSEAIVIVGVVFLQVKVLSGLLQGDSIV